MRCGFEHHAINFARGADARLHHMAFELRDAYMQQACDPFGRRKILLLWGPVRYGPGHNIATYHRNPDGYLIELFYDMDRMVDEELGYFSRALVSRLVAAPEDLTGAARHLGRSLAPKRRTPLKMRGGT
jgi:hypothetical protein